MFLCSRTRCRNRFFPKDDTVNLNDIPDCFEVHYIINCGHSLCEKCLFMLVQSDQRSYTCDQCNKETTLSARAYLTIKKSQLSSSRSLVRLNEEFIDEIPIDAYSLGLAFNEGRIMAAPVENSIIEEESSEPTMDEKLKYSIDAEDKDNARLKTLIPRVTRNRLIPLIPTMHNALATHAECAYSLKVLGNLEKKLSKEYYGSKMRLREKFQHLHALLQLEELKGMTHLDENYKRRKEEFAQVGKHLTNIRRQISEAFDYEHDQLTQLVRKRELLKSIIIKPSRISWRNYDVTSEFSFELDDYLPIVIKNSLTLDQTPRPTTITLEVVDPSVSSFREPLPLFRSTTTPSVQAPVTEEKPSEDKKKHVLTGYSLHSSPIGPGRDLVKLGNVITPSLFYVTIWNEPEKIEKMQNLIDQWCINNYTHPPPQGALKSGQFIFIYSDPLEVWARARLLSINTKAELENVKQDETGSQDLVSSAYNFYSTRTVDVQLLDFGGVAKIPYSKIRKSLEELFDAEIWPYLAVKCCIKDVEPKGDEWSAEAAIQMHRFCKNLRQVMTISEVVGDLHHIDLQPYEPLQIGHNSTTLRDFLIFGKFAIHKLSEQAMPIYDTTPLIEYTRFERIPTDKTEKVVILHIESPDLFYVARYSAQEKAHAMHSRLAMYFDLNPDAYAIHVPKTSLACIAFSENQFYRAVIEELLETDEVIVNFVDFGVRRNIKIEDLRAVRDEFLRLPCQAIPCKLADIGPVEGFKWSDDSIGQLHDLLLPKAGETSHILNLNVIDYEHNDKHLIELSRFSGIEYVSVNCSMVRLNKAVSTGPLTRKPNESMSFADFQQTMLDEKIFPIVSKYNLDAYKILDELVTRNREARSSKVDSYIKVSITHWVAPDEFYVQIRSHDARTYLVVYERKLDHDYSGKLDDPVPALQPRLDINEPVVFVIVEDKNRTWKRGIILERENAEDEVKEVGKDENSEECQVDLDRPDTKYTVLSRDYGFKVTVPREHIFKLPEDSPHRKDGDFCIRCHLKNLSPAGGGSWTKTCLETFQELIERYRGETYLFLVEGYVYKNQPQSIAVDLMGKEYHTASGILPTKTQYNSIGRLLIDKGLALPDRLLECDEIEGEDDLKKESPVKKILRPYCAKTDNMVTSYIRKSLVESYKQLDNRTVHFYKDPEKPKTDTFVGIPSEVDFKLKIWFREYRIDKCQPISVINRTIANTLKQQDTLLPFHGERTYLRACTAYFEYDHSWHRAEILYTIGDDKCCVRFVDFGNETTLTMDKLSSQVFHPEIPKLALNGYLADCKPVMEGEEAGKLVNVIYALIVDFKCVFRWKNFQSFHDMRVDVFLPDGSNLKEILIEKKFVIEVSPPTPTVPPVVASIIERMACCGYKPSTVPFKKDVYYPICITGNFYENYIFIQAKSIENPNDIIEKEITARNSEFIKELERFRANVPKFASAKEYKTGDAVAAQYCDLQWYRAYVMEVTDSIYGKKYKVFYVDYGNSSVVEHSKLKILPFKFRVAEVFAYAARICNIRPKNDEWSKSLLESMEGKISINEHSTIALFKNDCQPWDIEVFIADPENPRVPVNSLWQSFFDEGRLIELKYHTPSLDDVES